MTQDPNQILIGNVRDRLQELPAGSVQCCVTSPPYWGLRDYGVEGQLGLEKTPQEYIQNMVEVFQEVRRVLRDDGTLWLNIGDSYAGSGKGRMGNGEPHPATMTGKQGTSQGSWEGTIPDVETPGLKPKDLCLIPERLAIALQDDGWWIRSRIAWCKKSSMPESVTDRPTSAWEHIWLLTKSARYYYDAEAVRQPHKQGNDYARKPNSGEVYGDYNDPDTTMANHPIGANLRNYWVLGPEPYPDAHFATFPTEIPRRCIKAGTSQKGACSECGAPWERVVDKAEGRVDRPNHPHDPGRPDGMTLCGGRLIPGASTTTGWQPTCDHDAPTVPCTVLDPFLGSGTTAAVAQELDREWVGIELNPEYAALAEKRINAVGASQIGLAI